MLLSKWFVRGFRSSAIWHSTAQHEQSSRANWVKRTERYRNDIQKIITDVVANSELSKTPPLVQRFVKLLEYDCLVRVPLQGHMTMMAYEVLEKPENLNEQSLYKAQVVSCAMELAQSSLVIIDDYEDGSKTRHGKPCWHLLPEFDNFILNDMCVFRSLINDILRAHLKDPVCTKIMNIINQLYLFIGIGQYLDLTIPRSKDFSLYTRENYNKIVRYKCTYYCIELPIMLALTLCEKDNEVIFERVRNMVREVGVLYQMMNDLTDFNDDGSKSGKIGTDIQEGKCTWFVVKALERMTPEQMKTFKASFGSWNPEDVERVKSLYKDLDLISLYKEEHNLRYEKFMKKIKELPSDDILQPELFMKLMEASNLNNWNIY